MKKALLSLIGLISFFAQAQGPVETLFSGYPEPGTPSMWQTIEFPGVLNQSAAGANQDWVYGGFTNTNVVYYSLRVPTALETTTYPGTVLVNERNLSDQIFLGGSDAQRTITGISGAGLTLNYNTNSAALGTFPMSFGYTNSDTTAGTYLFDEYNGTFTGTVSTVVDGYGTLTLTDEILFDDKPVTRVKVTQTMSMNYLSFNNVGTVTQTLYVYYGLGDGPLFRTTTTTINVPLLGINETMEQAEFNIYAFLDNPDFQDDKMVSVVPNPVKSTFELQGISSDSIKSVVIVDQNGKVVSRQNAGTTFDIGHLANGVYFGIIESGSARHIKKIIKQ